MANITRENLVASHKQYDAELKDLLAKEYKYQIDRPVHPFGYIGDMDLVTVLQAHARIHEEVKSFEQSAAALGVDLAALTDNTNQLVNGYTTDVWDEDFKLRVQEIKDNERVEKLERALEKMRSHFSEDDAFAADMQELEDL